MASTMSDEESVFPADGMANESVESVTAPVSSADEKERAEEEGGSPLLEEEQQDVSGISAVAGGQVASVTPSFAVSEGDSPTFHTAEVVEAFVASELASEFSAAGGSLSIAGDDSVLRSAVERKEELSPAANDFSENSSTPPISAEDGGGPQPQPFIAAEVAVLDRAEALQSPSGASDVSTEVNPPTAGTGDGGGSSGFFLTSTNDLSIPSTPPITDREVTATPLPPVPHSPLPPISSYPPSALLPTLSLSALNSLLNFRRYHRPSPLPSPLPSPSPPPHSLSSALRALAHVLSHPLPLPSLPCDLSTLHLPTLSSAAVIRPPLPINRTWEGKRKPRYEREWDEVRREVERVRGEVAQLGRGWGLDEVGVGLMEGKSGGEGGVGGKGVRDVRKVRMDYQSVAHARGVNRVMRGRQREREERDRQELVEAVNSTQGQSSGGVQG